MLYCREDATPNVFVLLQGCVLALPMVLVTILLTIVVLHLSILACLVVSLVYVWYIWALVYNFDQ